MKDIGKRTIKFRAWAGGVMVYAEDESQDDTDTNINIDLAGYTWTGDADNFKLMQYTGLKDKNGVEIFESDVVLSRSDEKNQEIWLIDLKRLDWYISPKNGHAFDNKWIEREVIGNVFENESLLK